MSSTPGNDRAHSVPSNGEIAIVGMACMFPGAPDLQSYWRNIVSGYDAISDPPAGRWDENPFYDPTSTDDDRVYSQRGGYLPTQIPFDPLAYGIMPIAVTGGEVDQFLVLKLVYDALADAGYNGEPPNADRTEFVLGRGNYLGPGNSNLFQRSVGIEQALRILKSIHPEHTAEELEAIRRDLRSSLPNFGPELGPTHIPNVVTGRAANRLDLMGGNYTVDAACASSLIAIQTATDDLLSGKCDLAIAGGSHTFTSIPLLMVFCTLNALSHHAQIRPFDARADGILPGEGVGVVVLKRRADAERDGDRIYAVIKGVGSASDGRALSVMAPRTDGEILALRRAYERAGIDPRTVTLIEAHGTATPVGDLTEVETLKSVFGPRQGEVPTVAVGTVKSMIGHAMPASGIAGLIKTVLALYHKVLPPTLHCDSPSPRLKLDESPFYMNTQTRPWINGGLRVVSSQTPVVTGQTPAAAEERLDVTSDNSLLATDNCVAAPRRAGVNAFGFGGINAHVVLEEYPDHARDVQDLLPWDSELLLIGAAGRDELVGEVTRLQAYLAERPEVELADLAYTLSRRFDQPAYRLAVVAASREDLHKKLARAHKLLSAADCTQIKDPRGIYYFASSAESGAAGSRPKVAFMFPGEGSQRVNMLADLCLHFPEVRAVFDAADRDIVGQGRTDPISQDIFPPPFHSKEERQRAEQRLWRIDRQCEAIMPANQAMFTLFSLLGIQADMMVGHSIGEWSSITAGGITVFDPPIEVRRSLDGMAKAIVQDPSIPEAALLAVATNRTAAESIIEGIDGAYVAVDNCRFQVVIAASTEATEQVIARLRERGVGFERSKFDRGSHTPLFAGFSKVARRHFDAVDINAPRVDVYSCCTMAPMPHDPGAIRDLLVRSWEQPVEYRRTIEAMYDAGARIFVEVGPRGVLSAFTDDVLRGKNALVLAVDLPKWTELTGLNHLVGILSAQGFDLNIPFLYARRPLRELTLDTQQDARAYDVAGKPLVALNLGIPMMELSEKTVAALQATRRDGSAAEHVAGSHGSAISEGPQVEALPSLPTPIPAEGERNALPFDSGLLPAGNGAKRPIETPDGSQQRVPPAAAEPVLVAAADIVAVEAEMRDQSTGLGTATALMPPAPVETPAHPAAEPAVAGSTNGHQSAHAAAATPAAAGIVPVPPPPQPPHKPVPYAAVAGQTPVAGGTARPRTTLAAGHQQLTAPATAAGAPDGVMAHYMQTMRNLLQAEQRIMQTCLHDVRADGTAAVAPPMQRRRRGRAFVAPRGAHVQALPSLHGAMPRVAVPHAAVPHAVAPQAVPAAPPRPVGPDNPVGPLPLCGEVISLVPGQSLLARRRVDPDEDLYLHDHTFGGVMSLLDPTLEPLTVAPLTISLELMAEAAAQVLPGLVLTAMSDVRAHRWVQVDESAPTILEISAQRLDGPEQQVRVEVREVEATGAAGPMVIEGTMVFDARYDAAPPPQPLVLENPRTTVKTAEEMYREMWMFHGPIFQGVASLDATGDDGITGTLEVLPTHNLFRSTGAPRLLTDVALLDAAGQLLGYWAKERLEKSFVVFPIRIAHLHIYGPNLPAGTRVRCDVKITDIMPQTVRVDMDVYDAHGQIWMRIEGWQDWRFHIFGAVYDFWRFPGSTVMSKPFAAPLPARADAFTCCRMDTLMELGQTMVTKCLAYMSLNHAERRQYHELRGPAVRQVEWLAGRIAAKDAVRLYLHQRYGLQVYPGDIEIVADEHGRPEVRGAWLSQIDAPPHISLSHCDGMGIGIAGAPGASPGVGIDMQAISPRSREFDTVAFAPEELALLDQVEGDARDERRMRFWCAKEAVAKALGRGLVEGPRSVTIVRWNDATGTAQAALHGVLAAAFPHLSGRSLLAYTVRDGGHIVATSFGEVI